MSMKKTLISTAAAALLGLAGAPAQAEVSVYGLYDVSYGKTLGYGMENKSDAAFHSGGDDSANQGNSGSRLGFKASTDLGDGYKAGLQVEANLWSNGNTGDGSGTSLFNRQAFVSFTTPVGQFAYGRQYSLASMADSQDLNASSNGVSAGTYSGNYTNMYSLREDNLLTYTLPVGPAVIMLGYQAKGKQYGYVVDTDPAGTGTEPQLASDAPSVTSAALFYNVGSLALVGTYQSAVEKGGDSFGGVSGTYDFGVFKLRAGYEARGDISGENFGIAIPVAGATVGVNYSLNTGSYGLKSDGLADDVTSSAYEIFLNREIFKGTYAYAEYGAANYGYKKATGGFIKDVTNDSGFAVGMIFSF